MKKYRPIAYNLRPDTLNDIIGQTHLFGKGKILTELVEKKIYISLILYGKPGIGKNSIANALLNDLGVKFGMFNSAIDKKDRLVGYIEQAKISEGEYYIVIDEIHRLNKNLQDILLPHIESGTVKIIALTTENPFFVINPAIRSRCKVLELKQLNEDEILSGIRYLIDVKKVIDLKIDNENLKRLIVHSGGDYRSTLNTIDLLIQSYKDEEITESILDGLLNKANMYSDSSGDGHYDLLSALQKSIRGSDVDAALYWAARLLQSGDLESLLRRLQIIAFEDIGMANPNLPYNIVLAANSIRQIGLPEGRIIIGHVIVQLATSPKSNSAHVAFDMAISTVDSGVAYDIPKHLKDGHYASAKKLGNAVGYKYPHDFPNSYVKQQYLPQDIEGSVFYNPKDNKYENAIKAFQNSLK